MMLYRSSQLLKLLRKPRPQVLQVGRVMLCLPAWQGALWDVFEGMQCPPCGWYAAGPVELHSLCNSHALLMAPAFL
jgi:hypothetical protein